MAEATSNPGTGEFTAEDYAASLIAPEPSPKEEAPTEKQEAEAAPDAEDEAAETTPADEEDGDEAESEEDSEEEQPETETFLVKVDGEEMEVTRDELLNGYTRQADYQRKTQRISEERKALEAERRQYAEEQKQMRDQFLARMAEFAQSSEAEPDWLKLAREDPIGYVEKKAEWDAAQAKRQQAWQQYQAAMTQQHMQRLERGREALFEAIPEWKDPERYNAETAKIGQSAAKTYGFTAQELQGVADPRMVLVLRDAVKYRELQAKRPETEKKIAKAPKALKPGASASKSERKAETSRAVETRIRKTGSPEAFMDWMLTPD